ncbi:unnamed protein product [Urochloa humidicola]
MSRSTWLQPPTFRSGNKTKSRETDGRRRKAKKNNAAAGDGKDTDGGASGADAKENADHSSNLQVKVEYVPEKAEIDDPLLHDFKAIFEKFSFKDAAAAAPVEVHELLLASITNLRTKKF